MGKMVINRTVNMKAMKIVLQKIWKLSLGLVIKEVEDICYVFQFEHAMEKDRVLLRQPWSFNKSLIVFQEFNGMSSSEEVNMDWCQFWVQVHGLLLGLMNEKLELLLENPWVRFWKWILQMIN